MNQETELLSLIGDWTKAEESSDSNRLQELLTDDFSGIGPRGFVLDKSQWVNRFSRGFGYETLKVEDIDLKVHDGAAIVVARQEQRANYQGQPSNGEFRLSQTWMHENGGWHLANLQLSTIQANIPGQQSK